MSAYPETAGMSDGALREVPGIVGAGGDRTKGTTVPLPDPERVEVARELGDRLGVQAVGDIPHDAPPPPLLGRLDPEGHTILFGTGDVGKGTTASWFAVQLAQLGHVVLIVDFEAHASEWSRRIHGLSGPTLVRGIYHVCPTAPAWTGERGALWDQAEDLRAIADGLSVTYMVIDSVVVACAGTDAIDPAAAGQYATALAYIGRPALSIAHTTKAAADGRYPFGSVFWHNLARVTWSLSTERGIRELVCRKANNYPNLGREVLDITWHDGKPVQVVSKPSEAKLSELLAEALMDGPASREDLATRLEEDGYAYQPDSIGKALRRGRDRTPPLFEQTPKDKLWRNAR